MPEENVFESSNTENYEVQAAANEAQADVEFPESTELKDRVFMLEVEVSELRQRVAQIEELSVKFTSLRDDVAAAMKQMGFPFEKLAKTPVSRA